MDNLLPARPRRPLRDVVSAIDRDILKLLLRRYNMLRRMRNDKGFLGAEEERFLRAAWQSTVAGVSSDSRLSVHFFTLMQELEFLPRPEAPEGDKQTQKQRSSFNLAPPQKPVRLAMPGPLACRLTRGLLMLAAMAGKPLVLAPCLMNDPVLDCYRMLNQAGAHLTRADGGKVIVHASAPLGTPDKSLLTGDSAWNLYLMLAHYLWRPARAKFSGDSNLKMADLSPLRRFLPELGARLSHVIPRSNGLPARLECSGNVPERVTLPHDVPPEFGEALLLAACGHQKTLVLDIAGHPCRETLQNRILPLLRSAGADISADGERIRLAPREISLPQSGDLPIEPELALFLLALPLALAGGEVRLDGFWPSWPEARAGLQLLTRLGLRTREDESGIYAEATPVSAVLQDIPPHFPGDWIPLPLALAACAVLRDGEADITPLLAMADEENRRETADFLAAVGVTIAEDGRLCKKEQKPVVWNAPNPVWAMAYALAACARAHLKLGNPGILAGLYPGFWALYNALPNPASSGKPASGAENKPTPRRRVISSVPASIPQARTEDE